MSRPDRPYRCSLEQPNHTSHRDFATEEERAKWVGESGAHRLTTVTSRKPLKPGKPVAWVNVYAEGRPAAHLTKALADQYGCQRLRCIPVYLPGEGAAESTYVQAWRVLLGKSVSAGKTTDEVISLAYERYVDRAEERWRTDGPIFALEMAALSNASDSSIVAEVTIRPVCLGADPVQWAAVQMAMSLLDAIYAAQPCGNLHRDQCGCFAGYLASAVKAAFGIRGSLEREPPEEPKP